MHRFVQNQFAQTLADGRSARFTRHANAMAARFEPIFQPGQMTALACAINAFQGNEQAGHQRPFW
jgi:hypothetical protein